MPVLLGVFVSRIALLGATGKLGQQLLGRALDQGFTVSVLTRHPRRITRQNERLTVIKGDALTGEGLGAVLERCQFVICAIGSMRPVLETCLRNVVLHLQSANSLKRLVLISRLGTGESLPQSALASGPLQRHLPVILQPLFKDINAAESVVRERGLPYSIFRATRLTDDVPTEKVIAVDATESPPHRISRIDFAHFVIDSLSEPSWNGGEKTVGSA